ncbi:hypothetical protein PBAL39_17699 [Pedobacter sp. BAL39]|nr:hypothetical protein PBAL39_17699 [Pedobacter sp. BAL39]
MKMLDIKLLKKISEYAYSDSNGYVKVSPKSKTMKNMAQKGIPVQHKAHDFVRSLSGI